MTQTVSTAVATRDNGPSAQIAQYRDDFATVLPANIRAETFVRLAQGVLRRDAKLMEAAQSSPRSLLVALLDAARLGHEPGTPDYYLTPRRVNGQWEVLGIEGYRGVIRRMFNSGMVASVVAEVVCENDGFEYVPGEHERPIHHVDWFGDRGPTKGAYAYAVMNGGATSKVVVVGPREIERAQAASASFKSKYSPWTTDYDAMVRKTALHRLEPFVAKSSAQYGSQADANAAHVDVAQARDLPTPVAELPAHDPETGEITDPAPVDGEVVDESWPKDASQ